MNVIGIEIDRETGRVTGADMPPANLDVKALYDRELRPGSLFETYLDCLGGDESEQERMREHGGRGRTVPAVQGFYSKHDQMREPHAGQ